MTLLRDSTITQLARDSRAAGKRIVVSFVFVAFALMLIQGTLYEPEHVAIGVKQYRTLINTTIVVFGVMFAGGWMSAIINAILFFRIGSYYQDDEPPQPPAEDVSDTLIFDTEIPQPTVRLHYAEDSLIRVGRYQLTRRQWRTLASTLADLNWRWTRRNVGKAKVIKNLTAPGIYRGMTSDMERLGVVKNGYVTAQGRDVICEAAGLEVVL